MKRLNRRHSDKRGGPAPTLEALTTHELLPLHERLFGALDPKARTRILQTSRALGWTAGERGLDRLAA